MLSLSSVIVKLLVNKQIDYITSAELQTVWYSNNGVLMRSEEHAIVANSSSTLYSVAVDWV